MKLPQEDMEEPDSNHDGFSEDRQEKYINNKKKAISFEGAQYRRVRKLAEEHNKRHHSVQQTTVHEDENLIRGLIGMNNLI